MRNVGEYPEWDEDHPIHVVGHSAGAQVARLLQQMLADKVTQNSHFYSLLSLQPSLNFKTGVKSGHSSIDIKNVFLSSMSEVRVSLPFPLCTKKMIFFNVEIGIQGAREQFGELGFKHNGVIRSIQWNHKNLFGWNAVSFFSSKITLSCPFNH